MVDFLDNGNPDGTTLGQSATEKVSFYGATPVVQPSGTLTTLTSTATNSSPFGFSTSAKFNEHVALLEEIRATVVSLGLHKGS